MKHLISEEVGEFILEMMDWVDLYFRREIGLIYFNLSKKSSRHFMFKKDDGKRYKDKPFKVIITVDSNCIRF